MIYVCVCVGGWMAFVSIDVLNHLISFSKTLGRNIMLLKYTREP